MQSFGVQALSLSQPAEFNTGVGFEYLQIINNSPYFLTLNFVGQGSIGFPNWLKEDVPINGSYRGNLIITASNPLGLNQIVSKLVTVNAWSPGELAQPQTTPLTQDSGNIITSIAGQQVTTSTQNADNTTLTIGGGANTWTFLKKWLVTGDKSAAVSTGQLKVTSLLSGLDLWYWVNQGPSGTIQVGDSYDPPLQANAVGQPINIVLPNLSAGLSIVATVLEVPIVS